MTVWSSIPDLAAVAAGKEPKEVVKVAEAKGVAEEGLALEAPVGRAERAEMGGEDVLLLVQRGTKTGSGKSIKTG